MSLHFKGRDNFSSISPIRRSQHFARYTSFSLVHGVLVYITSVGQEIMAKSDGADEDPVDQKKYLEDACKPKCVKPLLQYQACVKRIEGDESGHKHCTGQYFDYWSCVDKCVAPKLFVKLK